MNWSKIVPKMSQDLQKFVKNECSLENLYKRAILSGIGPEVRPLVRGGAKRARRVAREALRRRNLLES